MRLDVVESMRLNVVESMRLDAVEGMRWDVVESMRLDAVEGMRWDALTSLSVYHMCTRARGYERSASRSPFLMRPPPHHHKHTFSTSGWHQQLELDYSPTPTSY
eukprot:533528-Pleurochrysis_carterae.AAC.1